MHTSKSTSGPHVGQGWRDPLIVLDASGGVPTKAEKPSPEMSQFTRSAVELLKDLSTGLVASCIASARLNDLAAVGFTHAQALSTRVTTSHDSARSSYAASSDLRPSEIDERIRYDEFFGIRRAEQITPRDLEHSILTVFAMVASDLAVTHVGLHELTAMLRGIVLATGWIEPIHAPVDESPTVPLIPVDRSPIGRFRVGHAVFAIFCNFGTHALRRVLDSRVADEDVVNDAAICVRASTAAMWYSISFPRQAYADEVRPLMDNASSKDHGFSGLDNFDFRRLREAWELLAVGLEDGIVIPSPSARSSLLRLFEVIVEDNEHHVLIAAEMVGMLPSLKFEKLASTLGIEVALPAVAALRLNLEERRMIQSRFSDGSHT